MDTQEKTVITVSVDVNAPLSKVWSAFTTPNDVMHWNFASDDWHCPSATNDLRVGGTFVYNMAAKDGSFAFDFGGVYDAVRDQELISYVIGDGRKVKVEFSHANGVTSVVESFEAEGVNPIEMQRGGWQAILNNFKKHAEQGA